MLEKFPTIKQGSERAKPEGEVQLEEVTELEKPIKIIIEKIKDRIERGDYGLIIGDDASGRIPTRILGGFMQEISRREGAVVPNIIFIPGKLNEETRFLKWLPGFSKSKKEQHKELDKYIQSKGATKEKGVLIITDTIQSGFSLKTLTDLLRKAGYRCDIATIGIEPVIIGPGIKENLRGVDIFSGQYQNKVRKEIQHTPLIYRKKSEKLSGVYKNPGNKVSSTLKSLALPEGVDFEDVNPESVHTRSSSREIQESIDQSRKDAKIMTNKLVDWYLHSQHEK